MRTHQSSLFAAIAIMLSHSMFIMSDVTTGAAFASFESTSPVGGTFAGIGTLVPTDGYNSSRSFLTSSAGNQVFTVDAATLGTLNVQKASYSNPYITPTGNSSPLIEFSAYLKVPTGGGTKSVTITPKINGINGTSGVCNSFVNADGWMYINTLVRSPEVTNWTSIILTISGATGVLIDDIRIAPYMPGVNVPYTPPTSSSSNDFVKVTGNQLTYNGTAITLEGINITTYDDGITETSNNLYRWFAKSYGFDTYEKIASWNMNAIRMALDWRFFMEGNTFLGVKPEAWAFLDQAIFFAKQKGLRLLIDMHSPVGGFQDISNETAPVNVAFWGNNTNATTTSALATEQIKLWVAIATRYQHEPTILGYDLINEPTVPKTIKKWYNWAGDCASAIWAVDQNHYVNVELPFSDVNSDFQSLKGTSLETHINAHHNVVLDAHNYDYNSYTIGADPSWLTGSIATLFQNFNGYFLDGYNATTQFGDLDLNRDGSPDLPFNSGEYGIKTSNWTKAPNKSLEYLQKMQENYAGKAVSDFDATNLAQYNHGYKAGRFWWTYQEGIGNYGMFPQSYGVVVRSSTMTTDRSAVISYLQAQPTTIIGALSTGLETSKGSNLINIYPNPTTDRFIVNLPGKAQEMNVKIFTYDGKQIQENTVSSLETIPIEFAQKGLFVVKIIAGQNVYSSKLAIK